MAGIDERCEQNTLNTLAQHRRDSLGYKKCCVNINSLTYLLTYFNLQSPLEEVPRESMDVSKKLYTQQLRTDSHYIIVTTAPSASWLKKITNDVTSCDM